MTLDTFTEQYFSFLLSGKAEDLREVVVAFQAAVAAGITLAQLQDSMNLSHASAEALCLLIDNGSVDGVGQDDG